MAFYVDTSAAVKLVVAEVESDALRRWLARRADELVTSDLTRTELVRAVRSAAPDRAVQARHVLETMTVMTIPTSVFERASSLGPVELRSLDALHVASALELGDELDAMVAYDDRLRQAAEANGIPTVAPGS